MVAIIKYFSSDVSLSIVLMFRYLFCLPILLIIGLKIGGTNYFKIKNKKVIAEILIIGNEILSGKTQNKNTGN